MHKWFINAYMREVYWDLVAHCKRDDPMIIKLRLEILDAFGIRHER